MFSQYSHDKALNMISSLENFDLTDFWEQCEYALMNYVVEPPTDAQNCGEVINYSGIGCSSGCDNQNRSESLSAVSPNLFRQILEAHSELTVGFDCAHSFRSQTAKLRGFDE